MVEIWLKSVSDAGEFLQHFPDDILYLFLPEVSMKPRSGRCPVDLHPPLAFVIRLKYIRHEGQYPLEGGRVTASVPRGVRLRCTVAVRATGCRPTRLWGNVSNPEASVRDFATPDRPKTDGTIEAGSRTVGQRGRRPRHTSAPPLYTPIAHARSGFLLPPIGHRCTLFASFLVISCGTAILGSRRI